MSGRSLWGEGGVDSELWELRATLGSGDQRDVCQAWVYGRLPKPPLSCIRRVAGLYSLPALLVRTAQNSERYGVIRWLLVLNQVVELSTT